VTCEYSLIIVVAKNQYLQGGIVGVVDKPFTQNKRFFRVERNVVTGGE